MVLRTAFRTSTGRFSTVTYVLEDPPGDVNPIDKILRALSGAEIREPVLMHGPFIMSDRSQINAAFARFRAREMGHLAPLPKS